MTSRAAKRQKGDDGQPIITAAAPAPAKEPVIEDPSSSSDDDDDSKMPKVAPRNLIKVRDSRSSLSWKRLWLHCD